MTKRTISDTHGFALVDLLIVILVLAILLTVAVPSYLGFRERADDAAAKASVRALLPAVEAYRAEKGTYAGMTSAVLKRSFDAGVPTKGIFVLGQSASAYCVSATVGGNTWLKSGASSDIVAGGPCAVDGYSASVLATPALVNYWRLNDAPPSSVAVDVAGGSAGAYTGGVTLAAAGALTTSSDKAATFNGSNAFVAITIPGINTAAGAWNTVEFWMHWDGASNQMPFGFANYALWLANGHFGFSTLNSDIWGISSAGLANRWVHVVAQFYNGDAKQGRLWIDGVEQTLTQRQGVTGSRTVSTNARISGYPGSNTLYLFAGTLDEVAVYNAALPQTTITDHYAAR